MHTEQVQKIPFKMHITGSQIVRAEQTLQSQLRVNIICNQACETDFRSQFFRHITCSQLVPAKQTLKSHFHLQPNHAC